MKARLVMRFEIQKYKKEYKKNTREWKHLRNKNKMEGISLGIFKPNSIIRKFCHKLVSYRLFDIIVDIHLKHKVTFNFIKIGQKDGIAKNTFFPGSKDVLSDSNFGFFFRVQK